MFKRKTPHPQAPACSARQERQLTTIMRVLAYSLAGVAVVCYLVSLLTQGLTN